MLIRWVHVFSLCYIVNITVADPFSLIAGGAVAVAGGAFWTLRNKIRCKLYECCDAPYIEPKFHKMQSSLQELVFGQHLVQDTVWNAVMAHWRSPQPRKPLVLSFHGYTGSGKNHVAKIIVDHLYKNGMKSSFVHHIVATSEYPDNSRMEEYQLKLRERILEAVSKCERATFIFDEIDKLPEQMLGAIKPFLDYYEAVRGTDFRRATFIFLSNRGSNAISNLALKHHESGLNREDLKLAKFERVVMDEVYNKPGGLKMSELISNHLIDHFVPFLPLEKQHVILCTQDHLKMRGRQDLADDPDFVNSIVDSMQYFPKGTQVFSSSGCKRVAQKADLEMSRRDPVAMMGNHDLDDL